MTLNWRAFEFVDIYVYFSGTVFRIYEVLFFFFRRFLIEKTFGLEIDNL